MFICECCWQAYPLIQLCECDLEEHKKSCFRCCPDNTYMSTPDFMVHFEAHLLKGEAHESNQNI